MCCIDSGYHFPSGYFDDIQMGPPPDITRGESRQQWDDWESLISLNTWSVVFTNNMYRAYLPT